MTDVIEAETVFSQKGKLGIITLNRPKALNSLTAGMCEAIHQALIDWADDDSVSAVLVVGAGEKAFCAGGDVVQVVKSYQSGGTDHTRFFRSEYRMNVAIDEFPKPYISFADGITMGGGVGVSIPGDYWIATEKTLFAMPETGLGLFPDVGGGWFLPRLPGAIGMYLALTGARLKADDLYHLGIATHVMTSADQEALIDQLAVAAADQDGIESVLSGFHKAPEGGPITALKEKIDQYYSGSTVEAIIDALKAGDDWAKAEADSLLLKSPTSLKLTFEQLVKGAKATTFREVMQMEYRMVQRCVSGHDFPEGVRALLIDKDRQTNWHPSALESVEDQAIVQYFAPLDDGDLAFQAPSATA